MVQRQIVKKYWLEILGAMADAQNIITSKHRLRQILAVSLYRNALYLITNTVVVSILSFLFWIVVARYYNEADVGYSVAIISAASLIATLSLFGFNTSIIRFYSKTEKPQDLINSCLTVCGITSLVIIAVFLASINFWSPSLVFVRENAIYSLTFIMFTLVLTLTGIICTIFIAGRRSGFVLFHNSISSLIKILLPVLFVVYFYSFGIVASWGIALGVALIFSLFVFAPKVIKNYRPIPTLKIKLIKDIWSYSVGNYLVYICMTIPVFALPIIVINLLGAEQNAYFYIAWTIATLLFAIPNGIALSLFAEGSHLEGKLRDNTMKSIKSSFLLLIPAMLILIMVGKWLLLAFGGSYSANSLQLLWVFVVSCLPLSIIYIYTSILRVTNRIKELVLIWGFMAVAILLISYIILPITGIIGIGYTWLGIHSIVAVYAIVFGRRLL